MPKGYSKSVSKWLKAATYDTESDFSATQGQRGAIRGNLATTGRGLSRGLTQTQTRDLAAISRLAARAGAQPKAVSRAQSQAVNRYGSAMGSSIAQQFGVARATARATGDIVKAGAKGASILARGGQEALGIAKAAAGEAAEGAQYAMAVALKSRYQTDASTAAQMQFELDSMRLQARLDLKNQKELMDYTKKLEEEQLGGRKGATEAADSLASFMPELRLFMDANPEANWAMVAQSLDIPPSIAPYLQEAFPKMKSRGVFTGNLGYDATVDAIVDSMLAMNPELKKIRGKLEEVVLSSLQQSWNSRTMGELDTGGGDGGGGLNLASPAGLLGMAVNAPLTAAAGTWSFLASQLQGAGVSEEQLKLIKKTLEAQGKL